MNEISADSMHQTDGGEPAGSLGTRSPIPRGMGRSEPGLTQSIQPLFRPSHTGPNGLRTADPGRFDPPDRPKTTHSNS